MSGFLLTIDPPTTRVDRSIGARPIRAIGLRRYIGTSAPDAWRPGSVSDKRAVSVAANVPSPLLGPSRPSTRTGGHSGLPRLLLLVAIDHLHGQPDRFELRDGALPLFRRVTNRLHNP